MIATFYSYKGGVGRTQLAANLAAYLCHYRHKKILLIDWDLEAPGLHFYFDIGKTDIKKGVIDIFLQYVNTVKNKEHIQESDLPVFNDEYIVNIFNSNEHEGVIDLITAGEYNNKYSRKTNNFNWHEFYENLDGKLYVEFLKDKLESTDYDYIFLDSRTGISDYSGICNVQMPDINVIVISPTKQNFSGSLHIANMIRESPYVKKGFRKSIILPVLSRIDLSIEHKSEEWIDLFSNKFGRYINELSKYLKDSPSEYIHKSMLDYKRDISFEEQTLFNTTTKEIKDKSLAGQYKNIATYLEMVLTKLHTKDSDKAFLKLNIDAQNRDGLIDDITKQIVNNKAANMRSIHSDDIDGYRIVCQLDITNEKAVEKIIARLKTIDGVNSIDYSVI